MVGAQLGTFTILLLKHFHKLSSLHTFTLQLLSQILLFKLLKSWRQNIYACYYALTQGIVSRAVLRNCVILMWLWLRPRIKLKCGTDPETVTFFLFLCWASMLVPAPLMPDPHCVAALPNECGSGSATQTFWITFYVDNWHYVKNMLNLAVYSYIEQAMINSAINTQDPEIVVQLAITSLLLRY
jgi:hypothetical protein